MKWSGSQSTYSTHAGVGRPNDMNVLLHSLLHDDPHQPGGAEGERETDAADSALAIGNHGGASVVAMARLQAAKREALAREHAISAREDTYL